LGFLLLVLEEEMDLEWLLDNSDEVVGDKRNIPIIFIRHRWISDPVKKASEPLLTSAAAANIDYSYVFPERNSRMIIENNRVMKKGLYIQ
jgi:hypothetical protein